MRYYAALYLCACHGQGWTPSDAGLLAFLQQIASGLRDANGRMHWQT